MNKLTNIVATAVSSLVLVVAIALPVWADGSSSTTGSTGSDTAKPSIATTTMDSVPNDQVTQQIRTEVMSHANSETTHTVQTKVQERAQEIIDKVKTETKTHTAAQREQYCTAHKQGLETKLQNLQNTAQQLQSKIDNVLTQATAYQQANNLTVSNYASLLATAQSDQATSASGVTALAGLSPSIDCNSTSVSTDVATFKAATEQERTALLSYRDAVKNLVQALLTAKGGN